MNLASFPPVGPILHRFASSINLSHRDIECYITHNNAVVEAGEKRNELHLGLDVILFIWPKRVK